MKKRQIEILNLIKLGKTNKEIGKKLSISENTVGTHLRIILTELKARTRAQAVYIAMKKGIIE